MIKVLFETQQTLHFSAKNFDLWNRLREGVIANSNPTWTFLKPATNAQTVNFLQFFKNFENRDPKIFSLGAGYFSKSSVKQGRRRQVVKNILFMSLLLFLSCFSGHFWSSYSQLTKVVGEPINCTSNVQNRDSKK